MDAKLEVLAEDYWNAAMELSPLMATLLGDHRFDDQVNDLSAEGEAKVVETMSVLLARAKAIAADGLDQSDRVTRGMLISELTNKLAEIEAFEAETSSDQMHGLHAALMRMMPHITVQEPEHAHMLVERYSKMGTMIDQAAERFREGLSKGHTPARTNIERSLSQLDSYLETPLEGDLIGSIGAPADWEGEPEWREAIAEQIKKIVRPAMDRYRSVLREELLPASRPDDRPGLKWMTDGDEAYDKYVSIFTSLDLSAEEIHEIGRHEVEELLPSEYEEIGGRALEISKFDDVIEALRSDPAMLYRDADQMFELAKGTMTRAMEVVPDWFSTTPEASCDIQAVPDAVAPDEVVAYYLQPAPDGSRPGIYFLNTWNAKDRNMFEAESIAFHEAIPGHHFQLALAAELDHLPTFQRHAVSTAFVEGWGLYTERLADEMNLYSSDIQRLGMLAADSWRACRLVVDTGLHFFGWTRQESIDYITRFTPVGPAEIAVEVDRYIGMPGQALAYKIGQREIFRLRKEAEAALGTEFDIKQFHDVCLTSGSVTLPILGGLVTDWVNSVGN